jgi:hypothetical protein
MINLHARTILLKSFGLKFPSAFFIDFFSSSIALPDGPFFFFLPRFAEVFVPPGVRKIKARS